LVYINLKFRKFKYVVYFILNMTQKKVIVIRLSDYRKLEKLRLNKANKEERFVSFAEVVHDLLQGGNKF